MLPTLLRSLPEGPGPVYHDDRNSEKRPWCFNVIHHAKTGTFVQVHRFRTEQDAATAREEWAT
jgi:hypothetical protein